MNKTVKEQNEEAFRRAFPKGPKRHSSEWWVHKRVVMHLKERYPWVRFYTSLDGFDLGRQRSLLSSLQWVNRVTGEMGGFPDLLVFGSPLLAIELKKDAKARRTAKQAGWLEYLGRAGFKACFANGLEEAINIIDNAYGKGR